MAYLGSWAIDDVLYFYANTTKFDTGVATDADAEPTYRVYENETGTALLNGTLTLIDAGNTAGFYSEAITLSAANGFEAGKQYAIYKSATVNSVVGATHDTFQVLAKVDARALGGTVQSATDLKDFADDGYDPATNKVQGVVLVDTLTTYTGNTPQTADHTAAIADLPTNAELATALGTADDAILVQVALVKAQTDKLSFDGDNMVAADAQKMNATTILGTGTSGDLWRG